MLKFLAEIDRRDRVLSRVGWFHAALLLAMLGAAAVDTRQVLGLNVWIKPIKFAASITIYVWTLAWFMEYLRGPLWCKGLVRWGVAVAMIVEIASIAGQSLRGVASHFNAASPLDAAIFSAMGLMIVFNSALEALLLALFLRPYPALPPAYLLGIRLGLAMALLSAVVGGLMIAHGGHTVGAPNGGAGLPLVNWSTNAGDLRVAHALGLHALQILPLAGYALSRLTTRRASLAATLGVAIFYFAVFGWTYAAATAGTPLISRPFASASR